jgi:hypothetical protein
MKPAYRKDVLLNFRKHGYVFKMGIIIKLVGGSCSPMLVKNRVGT